MLTFAKRRTVSGSRACLARGVAAALALFASSAAPAWAVNDVAGSLIQFNDNGAWSWFQDERAIVDSAAGKILVSSVAAAAGAGGAARNGDVDVAALDIESGEVTRFTLHESLQADDHDSAALWIRPDGRYLAVYARHNNDAVTRYRISANPGDISSWLEPETFTNPANVTYSNLHYLADELGGAGRLYNIARTVGFDPNVSTSTDGGEKWTYGGRLLDWPTPTGDPKFTGTDGSRPYLKYASNGADEIHFITTEDHPRAYDNSIYHGVIRDGKVYDSFGNVVDDNLFDGAAQRPNDYTAVFDTDGSPFGFAWTTDLELDGAGRPYAVFTTRAGDSTQDHRFHYARFDGAAWQVHEVARAGAFLYASEADYTGLAALDPGDPDRLFISTRIDPRTQATMPRYEIFEGTTADGGATWTWNAITFNSTVDNLRPIVPKWDGERTALLWFRGAYSSYTNYNARIVGLTEFEPIQTFEIGDLNRDGAVDLVDFAQYLAGLHADLSHLTPDEAAAQGDLNGDLRNDYADFVLFRSAYEAAHGRGSLAGGLAVPEPGAVQAVAAGAVGVVISARRLAAEDPPAPMTIHSF